ncbi:MAG: NAD(+)/NADH kinase [Bacilli bacterium]|nr:NAD(+)/NADH kinase [Bacilli bacterium]
MKYAVYTNEKENSLKLKQEFITYMAKFCYEYNDEDPAIVVYIGGDGTFLRAVQHYMDRIEQVQFIGVKTGALGFFCDYEPTQLEQLAKDIAIGIPLEYQYNLLEGHLIYENDEQYVYAVNEIRIEDPYKTLICDVEINKQHLEEYRGNGLLVSSTLGSTAYNKSCNGALIDHSLNVLQLAPINPIHNIVYNSLSSPMVLHETSKIEFKGDFSNIIVGFDNKIVENNDKLKSVEVRSSDICVTMLRYNTYNYIQKINKSFIKE